MYDRVDFQGTGRAIRFYEGSTGYFKVLWEMYVLFGFIIGTLLGAIRKKAFGIITLLL
jgi:hypothetical protein